MQNILKPIFVILGLVALGALVYVFVIQKEPLPSFTQTSTSATSATSNGQVVSDTVNVEEFQKLLMQLNAINLDSSIFASPQYVGLIDHTQTALIKLEATKAIAPISKQNPFQNLDSASPVIMLQATTTPRVTPRTR